MHGEIDPGGYTPAVVVVHEKENDEERQRFVKVDEVTLSEHGAKCEEIDERRKGGAE